MSWHVDAPVWEAYAAGRLDPVAELSVESHLTGCADCRAAARSQVAPADRRRGVDAGAGHDLRARPVAPSAGDAAARRRSR